MHPAGNVAGCRRRRSTLRPPHSALLCDWVLQSSSLIRHRLSLEAGCLHSVFPFVHTSRGWHPLSGHCVSLFDFWLICPSSAPWLVSIGAYRAAYSVVSTQEAFYSHRRHRSSGLSASNYRQYLCCAGVLFLSSRSLYACFNCGAFSYLASIRSCINVFYCSCPFAPGNA